MTISNAHDIDSLEALSALYGATNPISLAKETPGLTPEYRRWLEAASFFVIATAGPGGLDASPRGDRPGAAFRILDDRHIAIPDRRGNNRLDTLKNILADPRVALIFLIPGIHETLRLNGRARLTADPELLASFETDAKRPASAILLTIEAVYFQCARALIRAALWDPASRRPRDTVPTAGQMTRSAKPDFDADAYDAALDPRQQASLY